MRRQSGLEYAGYLVAVTGPAGTIMGMKCSKLDFERNASAILAAGARFALFRRRSGFSFARLRPPGYIHNPWSS